MVVTVDDVKVGPLTPAAGVTVISLDFDATGWNATWLEVYKSGQSAALIYGTDYSVTNPGLSGAFITLTRAANGTDAYTVFLATALERSSDLQLRGEFRSGPFNDEQDRVWQAMQYQKSQASLAIRVGATDAVPDPISVTPNRLIGFGSAGAPALYPVEVASTADESVVYTSVSTLKAATEPPRGAGSIWRAGPFAYEEQADNASADLPTTDGWPAPLSPIPLLVDLGGTGVSQPQQWGLDLTGATDESSAFQAICRKGGQVFIPDGAIIDGGGNGATLDKSVRIYGSGSANSGLIRDLTIKSTGSFEGVSIEGVRFGTSETSGAGLPPAAMDLTNIDHVRVRDCQFDNVRVVLDADGTATNVAATVEGCRFVADWAAWGSETQNDMLTVRGVQHIRIHGNYFAGDEVNRFMKLSIATTAGDPVTVYNPRGVIITENAMTGAGGTRGKQMIDCFSGTVQLIFSNNWCTATGHTNVIENKTGYSYTQTNTVLSHKIVNNYMVCDKRAILYQGSFGATDWTPNSYDDLLISGNTILKNTASEATIDVRFLHSLTITDNPCIKTASGLGAVYHVSASSCRSNTIKGNTFEGGEVIISKATSNAGGNAFNSQPRNIVFSNNTVREYDLSAAFTCNSLTTLESVTITGNIVETSLNAAVTAAFWIRSCTASRITCTGNTADHSAATSKDLLRVSFSAIDVLREVGNSWEPAPNELADDATPSLKAVTSGSGLVSGSTIWRIGGTTTITDLDDGQDGQIVTLLQEDSQTTTVQRGSPIRLAGGADFAMNQYDCLTLLQENGAWREISRSANA